ncbi:MAG: hypothetical protein HYZ54_08910 [Ignavibacteriae bacterium]|nr:hypothetical protein [Ignavibacteriota bacterium]
MTIQKKGGYPCSTKDYQSVVLFICAFFLLTNSLKADGRTVGLIQYNQQGQQEGYVLFAPERNTTTYLIDKCGYSAHSWNSRYIPGFTVSLLNDGSILRSGVADSAVLNAPGG